MQKKVYLMYLFSLWALVTIHSCPGSSWILATSPQPSEEMARSSFSLLCSCSFYPFFWLYLCTGHMACFSSALLWGFGWNQPSPLLLDRLVVSVPTPCTTSSQDLPFPDVFAYVSFGCIRWPLALFTDDPYQPALLFIDFQSEWFPCLPLS